MRREEQSMGAESMDPPRNRCRSEHMRLLLNQEKLLRTGQVLEVVPRAAPVAAGFASPRGRADSRGPNGPMKQKSPTNQGF